MSRDLEPPIQDDSGYRMRWSDIYFLGLDEAEVRGCEAKAHPLGMTTGLYFRFARGLWDALDQDGIHDADVRLKGSSVNFYSGKHKTMLYLRRDIYNEFEAKYGRVAEDDELNWIQEALDKQWPQEPRPLRRPFNALYRLKVHRHPSDYDLQISSDEIHRRAVAAVVSRGLPPEDALIKDPAYSFIDKKLVLRVCPALEQWRLRASDFLRYEVTVASFPSSGPPNLSDDPVLSPLSSHFRDTDWILVRPPDEGPSRDD